MPRAAALFRQADLARADPAARKIAMTPFELTLARAAYEARFTPEDFARRWQPRFDQLLPEDQELWSCVAVAVARSIIKAALVECEAVRAGQDARGITFGVNAARSIARGIEALTTMKEGAQ